MNKVIKILICIVITSALLFTLSLPTFALSVEDFDKTAEEILQEREELQQKTEATTVPSLKADKNNITFNSTSSQVTELDILVCILDWIERYIPAAEESFWWTQWTDEDILLVLDETQEINEKLDETQNFQYVLVFAVGFICGIKLLNCFSFWKW